MDMKDVAAISYDKAFNKKWWNSKRSFKIRGSGTGKALDQWQKNCKKSTDKMSFKEVQAAEDTCSLLRKCLKTAMSKCKDKQKETQAACKKYLKLVDEFETRLANRSKEVSNEIANVIVSMDDFRAKKLAPATLALSKLVGVLPQKRKLAGQIEAQAEKVTLQKEKDDLRKQIADESKALIRLEEQIGDVSGTLSKGLKALAPVIQTARKDQRFRSPLVKHQKEVDQFYAALSKGLDEALDLRNDLQVIDRSLSGTETAETAIDGLQNMVHALTLNPTLTGLTGTLDEFKEVAGHLGKVKDGSEVTLEGWDQIDKWEKDVQDELKTVVTLVKTVERTFKQAQAYAKPWKNVPKIQQLFKEAQGAYKAHKKSCAVISKLGPAILANIDKLQKQRK